MSTLRVFQSFLIVVVGALMCGQAAAQSCSSYLFPGDVASVAAAKINVARARILDGDRCPAPSTSCHSQAYLVQNDLVFRSSLTQGPYACVAFFNGTRQTTGWVEIKNLIPSPTPVNEGDWTGEWKRITGHSSVTIRRRKEGGYQAEALATYAVTQDNVRTGTAEGKLVLRSGEGDIPLASFGDPGRDRTTVCRVDLRRFGPWLLVNDGATDDINSACGGMGVTLNGIYRRNGPRKGH